MKTATLTISDTPDQDQVDVNVTFGGGVFDDSSQAHCQAMGLIAHIQREIAQEPTDILITSGGGQVGVITPEQLGRKPGEPPIDYRTLLLLYMDHVGRQEGTTFTGASMACNTLITPAERAQLRRLAEESEDFAEARKPSQSA